MFLEPSDLDPSSPVPLYRQLFDLLVDRIDHGDLRGGDPLPTEEWLRRTLGVSRATVNRAYAMLVEENCIDRRPGAGTFVRPRRLRLDPLLGTRARRQLAEAGRAHGCELLSLSQAAPTAIQRDRLGLGPGERVWAIERLHTADGAPVAVERSFIPVLRVPTVTDGQAAGPLAALLHDAGSGPLTAREVVGAVAMPAADAALLGTKPSVPAFRLERETFDADGACWEYSLRSMDGRGVRLDILTAETPDDPFRL